MDTSKLFTVLCCFILMICLVLSITTLIVLRNALEENDLLQQNAQKLANTLDGCVNELNQSMENDAIPTVKDTETAQTQKEGFCIRAVNGHVGVYTADGALIHLLDIRTETLPQAEREALEKGIHVSSWQELIALVQDYTA